jgi:divalent metal cation (Fe/Co/Zn/Cd) transporter
MTLTAQQTPSRWGARRATRSGERPRLLRRGLRLEYATLSWNLIGCAVLAFSAIAAGSVALAAFGIDSLIEILASAVVVWQLRGIATSSRTRAALRIIAFAFALLAVYIAVQSAIVLAGGHHPGRSVVGAAWLGVTAVAMFALAYGKADTGRRLDNLVLRTEARITVVDGALAMAILVGVVLNAAAGWWWADPVAALVLVVYGAREAHHAWHEAASVGPGRPTPSTSASAKHRSAGQVRGPSRRDQP